MKSYLHTKDIWRAWKRSLGTVLVMTFIGCGAQSSSFIRPAVTVAVTAAVSASIALDKSMAIKWEAAAHALEQSAAHANDRLEIPRLVMERAEIPLPISAALCGILGQVLDAPVDEAIRRLREAALAIRGSLVHSHV